MEIANLTKEIRNSYFEKNKSKTPDQVAASWYNDDLKYDGVGKTLFIILPTPGCSWALGDSGGCTMCSYVSDCTLEPIDSETILRIFNEHLNRYPISESDGKIAVKLFASGSFLNPYELPKDARDEILTTLSNMDCVNEIVVESRPEYVKEEYLDEVFSIIGDKLFEVSMGLETVNDYTRLKKINKGFSKDDFENAVNIISKLRDEKKYNIKSKAYIFVKPILVSEKEAIDGRGSQVGRDRTRRRRGRRPCRFCGGDLYARHPLYSSSDNIACDGGLFRRRKNRHEYDGREKLSWGFSSAGSRDCRLRLFADTAGKRNWRRYCRNY